MTAAVKIDSNITGLAYAEEQSPKVLPGTPVWNPLEPNSYGDFGGSVTTLSRNPINPSRQRKKGVVTDLEASAGFQSDMTQDNLTDLMQGFMFADKRAKPSLPTTEAQNTGSLFLMASTTGFIAGQLVKVTGFANSANNGLKTVVTVNAGVSVEVAETLVDETVTGTVTVVGAQGASGDIVVDDTGSLPALTSTTLDFTTLGLIPGEWIFVGGDGASEAFATAANNGFKRVRSIAANIMTFDKSAAAMVADLGTGKTIRLFVGTVIRNELGTLVKRRTYQLERTLGAPDDAAPSQIQSEYIVGAVPNELTLNVDTADKLTADLAFVAMDSETRTGVQGVKSGTRSPLVEADALNTSSNVTRIYMGQVVDGDPAPTPLFAYVSEASLTLNNNVSPNKAVGVLGAFDTTAGTFEVGGSVEAYFADVAAVTAIRNNLDITLDMHVVKANAGIVIDMPLLSLGDGRPTVEQDEPVKVPLELNAATASKVDADLDYTLSFNFFGYLPTLAAG